MSLSKKLSIQDVELQGKRVLIRVDFNVPLDGQKLTNNQRIVGALPTIRYAKDRGTAQATFHTNSQAQRQSF